MDVHSYLQQTRRLPYYSFHHQHLQIVPHTLGSWLAMPCFPFAPISPHMQGDVEDLVEWMREIMAKAKCHVHASGSFSVASSKW